MRYLVFIFSLISFNTFSMTDVDDNLVKTKEVFDSIGMKWRHAENFAHRSEFSDLKFKQMAQLIAEDKLDILKAMLVLQQGKRASKHALRIAREKIATADLDISNNLVMEIIGYGECGEQSSALAHALVMAGVEEVSIYCINELTYNHAFVVIKDKSGKLYAVDKYLDVIQPLEEFWTSEVLLADFRRVLKDPDWTPPLHSVKHDRLQRNVVAIFVEQTRYAHKYQQFHEQIVEQTEVLRELFTNDEKLKTIKNNLQKIDEAKTAAEIGALIRGLLPMFDDCDSCNADKAKTNLKLLARDCGLPDQEWRINLARDCVWLMIRENDREQAAFLVKVLRGLGFPLVALSKVTASPGESCVMVKQLSSVFRQIKAK